MPGATRQRLQLCRTRVLLLIERNDSIANHPLSIRGGQIGDGLSRPLSKFLLLLLRQLSGAGPAVREHSASKEVPVHSEDSDSFWEFLPHKSTAPRIDLHPRLAPKERARTWGTWRIRLSTTSGMFPPYVCSPVTTSTRKAPQLA